MAGRTNGSETFFLVSASPSSGGSHDGASPSSPGGSSNLSSEGPVSDFEAFLQRYRTGQFDMTKPIEAPPSILNILSTDEAKQTHFDGKVDDLDRDHLQLYAAPEDARAQEAASLLDFYRRHRYLPAPKMPYEQDRLRLMRRFGLDDSRRKSAIQRISRLAKTFFQSDIVIVTLVFSDKQVFAAENDWPGAEREPSMTTAPRTTPVETSFCTHNLLQRDPRSLMIVDDATNDWRFKGNPYTITNGGAIGSYTAASIALPSSTLKEANPPGAASATKPELLPVGSICLLGNQPRPTGSFPDSSRKALLDFAEMIARELQLGYEQMRRQRESLQAAFLTGLLRKALVQNDYSIPSRSAWTASVATELKRLTSAKCAAILDFRSCKVRSRLHSPAPTRNNEASGADTIVGSRKIKIVSIDGEFSFEERRDENLEYAAAQALLNYEMYSKTLYDVESDSTLLEDGLVPISTTASCIVPVIDLDMSLSFLIVLTSGDEHFRFDTEDVAFVEAVGSIIMASSLREKATLADRAKLAFVSQVSHELRTPLHSVQSQLALLREFSSPSQLRKLSPLLDVADVCLESLRDVLDDTLIYAKLTNNPASDETATTPQKVDLDAVLDGILKATWIRKRRTDLVEGGANQSDLRRAAKPKQIDVIYEKQVRPAGWQTSIDVSGMKRVLLNIVGNALKFTEEGSVSVRLEEAPEGGVRVSVSDTGCGMSEDFLRDGRLFIPFLQENSFSHGAGLGMSICDAIVRKRMKGKIDVTSEIGKGTTVSITVPVALQPSTVASTDSTRSFERRIVSDELDQLFTPRPDDPMSPAADEQATFDFSTTIRAARDTLGRGSGTNGVADEGMAIDLAKLQLGQATQSKASLRALAASSTHSPETTPVASPTTVRRTASDEEKGASLSPLSRSRPSTSAGSANGRPRLRVLVVDDNSIARTVLARLLAAKGIDYSVAVDGQEAVELYAMSEPYQLCFMDFQMPRLDGLQASRAIRAIEKRDGLPRCRIVALTGLSTEAEMASESLLGEEDPIDRWLTKGGKAMRTVIEEVTAVKERLYEQK